VDVNFSICLFVSLILSIGIVDLVFAEIDSPRKQVLRGVLPEDVICKTDYFLVILKSGKPACVTLDTANKLEKLDLVIIPVNFVKAENQIETIPASLESVVNFYVNDLDLDTSPNGIDIISTEGLIEVTVNGVQVDVPSKMIETAPNSGKFFLKIELPDTINGQSIDEDDIVLVKYIDESDASGEQRIIVKSFTLSKTYANLQSTISATRIGQEFTVRLYEPDANRDSKDEDKISLSYFEFRSEGGIRTTLANPAFDANSAFLIETGPNSNIFEVKIKIPRTVDGKTIHIGDWYEIRYIDNSTPSNTEEEVVLKGRIG
jgi:hypothetical protein